ncbi:MAG: hypothetical protein DWQ51_16565 [Microcystis wesenbergii TW10]|uniref:Uncharacterized protein n=1 Tax=Microcystis wesenbergii TW10 TaxID=2060474 RepID=A0A3E0LQU4_9CHRO|nr:MAG: hypothetical protein DWQ51_16565 [Microcystis wesenbergii TW10]
MTKKAAVFYCQTQVILNPLSIGYILGQAKGKRQKAKGREISRTAKGAIDNQSLITGFSVN